MTLISRVALRSRIWGVGVTTAVAARVGETVGAGGTGVGVAAGTIGAGVAVANGVAVAAGIGVGAASPPPQATNSTKTSTRRLEIGNIRHMGAIIAPPQNCGEISYHSIHLSRPHLKKPTAMGLSLVK